MKKLVTVTGCFMLLCIVITSVILPSMPRTNAMENNIDADANSVVQDNSSADEEEKVFIIKEYNGKVAVFEGQNENPLFVSDVFVSNLPEADKELLESGIEVKTEKQLNRLIEDYCS